MFVPLGALPAQKSIRSIISRSTGLSRKPRNERRCDIVSSTAFKEDNPVSMIGALFMTLQKPLFLWVYLIHLTFIDCYDLPERWRISNLRLY